MSETLAKTKAVTASDICMGLRKRYCAPEWALFLNVANGTGMAGYRYADAIGMSLFPSRGLELHGFEVKVSKSDWRREAADPEKAETIAAYCDRWWIVTPPALLENENLPPNWGWLAYDGRAFFTKQKALKTETKALDRPFLAALLRRAHESNEGVLAIQLAEKSAGIQAEVERRVAQEVERRTQEHKRLMERVAAFELASGVEIDNWRDKESVGKAVAIVEACGVTETYNSTFELAKRFRHIASKIDDALKEAGFQPPEQTP